MMAENWVNFSSSVFLISFLFNLFLLLSVSKMFTLGNKDILKYANLSRANICIWTASCPSLSAKSVVQAPHFRSSPRPTNINIFFIKYFFDLSDGLCCKGETARSPIKLFYRCFYNKKIVCGQVR